MVAAPAHYDGELDIDYTDIYEKYQVEADSSLDNILVIDGIPVVNEERKAKLFKVLRKTFSSKAGVELDDDAFFMPLANGEGQGYVFATLPTTEEATLLLRRLDGVAFDKNHTFFINRFTEVEKYAQLAEEYAEPPAPEYKEKEHLRSWLADPAGRDQFIAFRGDEVSVNWHGRANAPADVAHVRQQWTNSYMSFSPNGTYVASLHRQGVILHGGPSFAEIGRFAHPNVKLIDFSPNESYFVTWSNEPIVLPPPGAATQCPFTEDDEGNSIAVWDIRTFSLLRTFAVAPGKMQWPILKWSGDEKYVGRLTPGSQISVYQTPEMGLVDKKSIKIEGVVDFEWAPFGDKERDAQAALANGGKGKGPRENMLAFWTPEVENQPARVTLMAFPSRAILRSKNLFNVSDAKLFWQNNGDFLCVKVDRHTKTKKSIFCNLELFRVREKDYPVEVVELKDTVTAFAWEPKGERFAIISSNDPNLAQPTPGVTIKTSVSFYQLDRTKGDFKLLKTLENKTTNTIFWSPRGRHVVLATLGSSTKFDIEFWDVDYNADDRKDGAAPASANKEDWGAGVQLMSTGEHYGITDIEWDPSGRFLATSASSWRHTLENGYTIWDLRGTELQKHVIDKFKQFLWRPRPRTLLPKDEQKRVRKTLREYSRTFDDEDAAEESNVSAELLAHRKRLIEEWNAWRQKVRKELAEECKAAGKDVPGVLKKEEADTVVEDWVEEIIEETEEVLVG